jgi:hypothetical protein
MKPAALLVLALVSAAQAASVELPPGPKLYTPPPKGYWDGRTAFPSYVIQTNTGRVECPRRWYEPTACRPYIPGRDRRPRAFVRKEGAWMVCPRPSGLQGCVGLGGMYPLVEQE